MWCSYRFRKEKMDCKFLVEWGQKWSQLIRLHNSWLNYIWSKNWWINLTFGIQIDLRNVKSCSKILSCAWLKILSANRIVRFLNQLYLKKSWWIGLFFLAWSYRFKKHKRRFVNFCWVTPRMHSANQIVVFLSQLYFK